MVPIPSIDEIKNVNAAYDAKRMYKAQRDTANAIIDLKNQIIEKDAIIIDLFIQDTITYGKQHEADKLIIAQKEKKISKIMIWNDIWQGAFYGAVGIALIGWLR